MYWRALAGREKTLGPNHPDTLRCMIRLVAILHDQGKYSAAEMMYQRAITEGERARGSNYRTTLRNSNCLSMFLQDRVTDSLDEASSLI
jgi:hypothetical protein